MIEPLHITCLLPGLSSLPIPISPLCSVLFKASSPTSRPARWSFSLTRKTAKNEGDLVLAAEHLPQVINFMAKYARGLICLTLSEARCRQLNLPLMVSSNGSSTAPTSPVDRSRRRRHHRDFRRHRARTGGRPAVAATPSPATSCSRASFAQGAKRRRAGARRPHRSGLRPAPRWRLEPASVICEIMNDDGTMARLPSFWCLPSSTA